MKATFDKEFTSGLRRLAIPIIAQSLLSTAIGTADTLMLNAIGQTELSAVSLANNLSRILSNLFLGLIVGTSVLLAQYLSSAHREKINNVFSISCLVAGIACSTFFLLATLAAGFIMQLFTNDQALIRIGMQYLRIVGFSFLFMTFTQPYLVMLKAMRKPTKSMIISTTALVINLIFNAVFIFGLFGAPKLGVRGVAIATVISRAVEFVLCLVDYVRCKYVHFATRAGKKIWNDFFRISIPQTTEGLMWILAFSAMASIMGHINEDIVAASTVSQSIYMIARVASIGLADAGAILLGGDLGRQDFEKARAHASQLTKIAIMAGAAGTVLMLLAAWPVIHMLRLTDRARQYLTFMFIMQAFNVIFAAITYEMLCGVFTAGGDTRFGMIADTIIMWVMVGLGFLTLKLGAAPLVVFFVMKLDEAVKTPVVLWRYKKEKWLRNITEEQKS